MSSLSANRHVLELQDYLYQQFSHFHDSSSAAADSIGSNSTNSCNPSKHIKLTQLKKDLENREAAPYNDSLVTKTDDNDGNNNYDSSDSYVEYAWNTPSRAVANVSASSYVFSSGSSLAKYFRQFVTNYFSPLYSTLPTTLLSSPLIAFALHFHSTFVSGNVPRFLDFIKNGCVYTHQWSSQHHILVESENCSDSYVEAVDLDGFDQCVVIVNHKKTLSWFGRYSTPAEMQTYFINSFQSLQFVEWQMTQIIPASRNDILVKGYLSAMVRRTGRIWSTVWTHTMSFDDLGNLKSVNIFIHNDDELVREILGLNADAKHDKKRLDNMLYSNLSKPISQPNTNPLTTMASIDTVNLSAQEIPSLATVSHPATCNSSSNLSFSNTIKSANSPSHALARADLSTTSTLSSLSNSSASPEAMRRFEYYCKTYLLLPHCNKFLHFSQQLTAAKKRSSILICSSCIKHTVHQKLSTNSKPIYASCAAGAAEFSANISNLAPNNVQHHSAGVGSDAVKYVPFELDGNRSALVRITALFPGTQEKKRRFSQSNAADLSNFDENDENSEEEKIGDLSKGFTGDLLNLLDLEGRKQNHIRHCVLSAQHQIVAKRLRIPLNPILGNKSSEQAKDHSDTDLYIYVFQSAEERNETITHWLKQLSLHPSDKKEMNIYSCDGHKLTIQLQNSSQQYHFQLTQINSILGTISPSRQ
jgi:hypothetical protein